LRLIFLGDFSIDRAYQAFGDFISALSDADCVLANLEGAIIPEAELLSLPRRKTLALANSPFVLDALQYFNVDAVCLANNHMYDFRLPAQYTTDILAHAGIASFGAGANLAEASQPFVFRHNDTTLKVFSFSWDVIGSLPATQASEGVSPLTPEHTLNTIRQLRTTDISSFVIFIMHWNYELELYPQPAHRQLAHDLLRQGVDAIIGLHTHVAQGAELVDGKPVVYGLGNWFFPPRQLGHIRLAYPPIASRELALELDIEGRQVRDVLFHWHQFDVEQNEIHFEKTERWDGAIIRQLTPYAGMSHTEYVQWFKSHRTQRLALPVYVDYRHCWQNWVKDQYVRLRQEFIKLLIRAHLKGGPQG